MWTTIARIILRNRLFFIIILSLITLFMGYKAMKVEMSYEYAKMLPDNDPAAIDYAEFRRVFGEEPNIFAVGFQDSDFFELNKFNSWRHLTENIKKIDGVVEVFSISQVFNMKKDTAAKKFVMDPIFSKTINSQAELDSLSGIALSLPFYKNLLYNDTSKVYLMTISLSKQKVNSRERMALVKQIKEEVDKFGESYNIKLHYSGMPYIRTTMMMKIKAELFLFIFLASIVCALILYFFFRSYRVVMFSMLIVSMGVTWSLGILHLCGYKITVLTGLVPTFLIVIGIENAIYLLNKYHTEFKKHANKIKSLQRVIQKTGKAIFFTNLATAIGFGAFMGTRNQILFEFGLVSSLSVLCMFLLALLLIPIFFSFSNPPEEKHIKHLEKTYLISWLKGISHLVFNRRKWVFISSVVLIVIGFLGVLLLKSTGYVVDDISTKDPIYIDLKFFEKNFNGIMPFEISINTGKANGVMNLRTLKKMEILQKKLSNYPEFSRPLSIVEATKFARQAFYNGSPRQYMLPDEFNQAFILSYVKKVDNDRNITRSFIDSTKQTTRISIQIADVGTERFNALYQKVKADVDSVFPPSRYKTIVTGNSLIYTRGTGFLIGNLGESVLLAILIIALIMASLFASFRMVLISIIPNLIPLLLTAALMGFLGIPVKPSTIIIFSIAFGISIDNTIQFLIRYRQELDHHNWNVPLSCKAALGEAGVSMIYTSVILFFGFGLFVFSSFGGTQALGILLSITLFFAMFANLMLLPSLLLSLEKKETVEAFKEALIEINDEENEEDDEELKEEETINKKI